MPGKSVYFAHGKESGPWGTKITALAEVAGRRGYRVESPDYSGTMDPDQRVRQLLDLNPAGEPLVLAGSSMGGYVSAVASSALKPAGLFLLAPAFYIEGYQRQEPEPDARVTHIIHGRHDTVVPLEYSQRYARRYHLPLHILDSDHRLTSALTMIEQLFDLFLDCIER